MNITEIINNLSEKVTNRIVSAERIRNSTKSNEDGYFVRT